MRDSEEKNNIQPDKDELPSTVGFSGLAIGPGSQIGRFRIEKELGRGGMGVVYLAQDTNLGRPVAIKILPEEVVGNPLVRKRWKREAQLLALLNHPNIATIHEVFEEAEGVGYLILEYVPGQTLSERIAHGAVKLEEALSMALQIAEAMAAAHEHGVIHRDLKPGNIKITPEGNIKVLDFGLAKAVASETLDQQSTTTEPGRVIGTPPYMSPEQARGNPVDHRSDIWSFGCVLYEMLTGEVPFKGETSSDTLANILGKDPDWQVLPQTIPPNIQVLLRRCLEKNLRSRLQHIGDAVIEIRETLSPPPTASPATRPTLVSLEPGVAVKASLRRIAMVIGATIIVVAAIIAAWLVIKKPSLPLSKEIRLVVLPFENLGPSDDEYFAAGITDAITARLATIHGLAVISRQSAMQYKKREKSAQQIANELRVDYILEGTVQRERPSDPNSRVRIIPQLIKASNDTHVWAQAYDNDMSEVFRIQSDLAERVAQALDIALVERERQALRSRPTENMEAYDYFLRGNEYRHRIMDSNDLKMAIQMYERAVNLDPKFVLAYAQLSRTHASMYWSYYDRTEERLGMAKKAVDKALQLAPDSPETHFALGHYYYSQSDWDRALEEFAIARKSQPNNSDLLSYIGYVQRRQGKFEESLANIKRASELDPLSNSITINLVETFQLMRNYPEAMRYSNRAISLAPDLPNAYSLKAWLYLFWEGSTEKARAVVEDALKNIRSPEEFRIRWLIALDVYEGNYQKALDGLSLKSKDIDYQLDFIPRAMLYAEIYRYMNENGLAKKYYDEGRNILEAKIRQQPDDTRFHSALGIAYAGLGRREDAIREGKLAVELLPVNKDAYRGFRRAKDLAQIYVMVGEFDAAIDQLEFLLSIPGDLSVPLVRLEPVWAPLREHPRFKKLLEARE